MLVGSVPEHCDHLQSQGRHPHSEGSCSLVLVLYYFLPFLGAETIWKVVALLLWYFVNGLWKNVLYWIRIGTKQSEGAVSALRC